MTSQFTIDDIVTKRLTVDGKRIQSLNLGTLVVIDPSYNVGIGTDIPKLRLDISGSNGIRIPVGTYKQRPSTGGNGPTDLSGVLRYNTTLNQYEGWALDGWQAFGGSSLQLYSKETGFNPMIKLTKEITTYGGNDDGGVIEFCLKNQSDSVTYQAKISALDSTNSAGYGSLVFSTSGGGSLEERMIIDHDGNVGIGTDSPSVSLEIGGTDAIRIPVGNDTLLGNGGGEKPSGADGMIRYNNVSNQFEGFGNGYWGSLGGVTSVNQYNKITADDSNGLRFYTSGSSADIQRMKIDNNGYIGINIEPSSSYQLHVNGTMRVTGTITGDVTGNVTGNLTGNATSATKLQNSRTIGGVSFNGSANINLPGVNVSGTQNTTGNASTVTNGVYTNTTQTISGAKTFTSDINIDRYQKLKIYKLEINQNQILNSNGTLFFQHANSNDVSICYGGGNVGIGLTSPESALHVKSTKNWQGIWLDDEGGLIVKIARADTAGEPYMMLYSSGKGVAIRSASHSYFNGGNVGIGTTSPGFPLHVSGQKSSSGYTFNGWYGEGGHANAGYSNSTSSQTVSGYFSHDIWAEKLLVSSDERIKENIRDVSDNASLQKLRDISCCFYEYKDKVERSSLTTIGFIAQQVKEHIPLAVSIQTEIIPNEMRKLEDVSWNGFNMSSDLSDCSGVKYRFYVSNDISGNEKMKEVVGNEDNTFTFDQSWNNVFCYGKEVDDFHTLDKQKIFALAFSATQEIDKIQQAEKTKLEEQTSKLAAAETEIATLNTKNQELESKLAEQTTILTNLIEQLKANNTIN